MAEKDRPSTSEDPSPIFMIMEVLGDLASEAEIANSPETEGEEMGSSSTLENSVSRMLGSKSSNCPLCVLRSKLKG